jgi:hypothetical protein
MLDMPSLGGWEWVIIGMCCLGGAGAVVDVAAYFLAKRSNKLNAPGRNHWRNV